MWEQITINILLFFLMYFGGYFIGRTAEFRATGHKHFKVWSEIIEGARNNYLCPECKKDFRNEE